MFRRAITSTGPAARRSRIVAAVLLVLATLLAALPATAGADAAGAARSGTALRGWKRLGPVYYLHHAQCPGKATGPLALDVYVPQPAPPQAVPAVMFVHGGSFIHGSRRDPAIAAMAERVAENGWVAFSIDYCLPPVHTPGVPVEEEDTVAAYSWITEHAATYGVDPHLVGTWGTSAGANLAVQAAMLSADPGKPGIPPAAVTAGWSGPYDFVDLPGVAAPQLATVKNYLGCYPLEMSCAGRATAASPVFHVTTSSPPVFMANSTHEIVPLHQVKDMAYALGQDHVAYGLHIMPGNKHATAYTAQAFCPTLLFFEAHLGHPGSACGPGQP